MTSESAQDLSGPFGDDRTVWFNYSGTEILLDGIPATARPDAPHSIGSTLQLAILIVPVHDIDQLGLTLLSLHEWPPLLPLILAAELHSQS